MLSCSKLKVSVHRSTDRLGTQFGRPSALRQRSMGLERLGPPRSKCAASPTAMAAATAQEATEQDFTWKGSDDFTHLDDRKDATPLPLPKLTESKRIVLVRHGQSTWNAEGRIQGSTDFAELTDKGRAQAETTRITLVDDKFDLLVHSPLARAAQTAEIIWGNRKGPTNVLPSLREIDLYSFQGLLKHHGKEQYGEQFKMWQRQAAEFEIDGRPPVRELWFRASLAWQQVLADKSGHRNILVVAHNAVNQALVATAIGLPPTYFRRLLQNNAATTVLDFQPNGDGPPRVNLDRLNQTPGPPFMPDEVGVGVKARIIFVQHGATMSSEDSLLMGTKDEELTTLGDMQASKVAELIMDVKVQTVLTSPLRRAQATAQTVSKLQSLAGSPQPKVQVMEELTNRYLGGWEGRHALEARGQELGDGAETLDQVWQRAQSCWQHIIQAAQSGETGGPKNVVVVGHSVMTAAMLGHCLGLGQESMSLFKTDCGGITVVDFPREVTPAGGVVQCINYTAHLGRWSVPITNDNMDSVCGIEGCF